MNISNVYLDLGLLGYLNTFELSGEAGEFTYEFPAVCRQRGIY